MYKCVYFICYRNYTVKCLIQSLKSVSAVFEKSVVPIDIIMSGTSTEKAAEFVQIETYQSQKRVVNSKNISFCKVEPIRGGEQEARRLGRSMRKEWISSYVGNSK